MRRVNRKYRRGLDEIWPWVIGTVLVTAVIISMVFTIRGWVACNQAGGAYVKGVFWYECIARPGGLTGK